MRLNILLNVYMIKFTTPFSWMVENPMAIKHCSWTWWRNESLGRPPPVVHHVQWLEYTECRKCGEEACTLLCTVDTPRAQKNGALSSTLMSGFITFMPYSTTETDHNNSLFKQLPAQRHNNDRTAPSTCFFPLVAEVMRFQLHADAWLWVWG